MSKHIVICMDGTWNDPTERTNVYRLFRALAAGPQEKILDHPLAGRHLRCVGEALVAFYLEGVGARGRREGVVGGALGIGLHARVLDAFLLVSQAYEPGDKLWIFGFSRGAWSARSLAGFIAKAGLFSVAEAQAEGAVLHAHGLWLETKRRGVLARGDAFWEANDPRPIRLVGVWETVGALGVPWFNGLRLFDRLEKRLFDFADLQLNERVAQGRHALAIDEQRLDFAPTPWTERAAGGILQVWFPGVHSDVGGGYRQTGLSDIALEWMLEEASALGPELGLDPARLEPPPQPDPLQRRHDEARKPLWKLRPRGPRRIDSGAVLHSSVLERLHRRPDYRPSALKRHPDAALLFSGSAPAEEVLETGERMPTEHLEPEASVQDEAFAQKCWNALGLEVWRGERYEISASGQWTDRNYQATAEGYPSPNLLLRAFEGSRRVQDANWFCLIACVNPDPGLESHNPDAGNLVTGLAQSITRGVAPLDETSQLQAVGQEGRGQLTVECDGYLYLFANDAAWAYSNNCGYLSVTVTRRL
jgi:uncharacterized protein (DUF2235 family)